MKLFIKMFIFGLVAIILETTWLNGVPSASVRFDLIIVAVAAISFKFEPMEALPVILMLGFLVDCASSGPFGISIFSYLVIYGFIRTIISKISFQAGPALLFWVAVVSFTDKILRALVILASSGEWVIPETIIKSSVLQVPLDALVGFPAVLFINWYLDLTWEKLSRSKRITLGRL